MSEWGPWSYPDDQGLSKRVRTITQAPLHGGTACPPLEENRNGRLDEKVKLSLS